MNGQDDASSSSSMSLKQLSAVQNVDAHRSPAGDSEPLKPPENVAHAMLHLMRTTHGRMRGHVFFRRRQSHLWQPIYCVVGKNGALRSEDEDEAAHLITFIRDLRGCKVYALLDEVSAAPILHIRAVNGSEELQLRPMKQIYFYTWFAALLCWQSVRASQEIRHMSFLTPTRKRTSWSLYHDFHDNNGAIIQSHVATLIEPLGHGALPFHMRSESRTSQDRNVVEYPDKADQIPVICNIHNNGRLVIQTPTADQVNITTVKLFELPRSSIQRVDKHVFDLDRVFGIFPQYALTSETCSRLRPVYLSYKSVESFEASFALFRLFASPEPCTPRQSPRIDTDSSLDTLSKLETGVQGSYLRMESSLGVQVNKARLRAESEQNDSENTKSLSSHSRAEFYVEILVDRQLRARTTNVLIESGPSWYENHVLHDLINSVSVITVRLIKIVEVLKIAKDYRGLSQVQNYSNIERKRQFHGEVDIQISDLADSSEIEQWWPVVGENGALVGDVSIRLQVLRENILAEREYDPILKMLTAPSPLTLRIWRHVPEQLAKLAEYLLNIFQTSGTSAQWLKYLASEEIDNGSRQAENSRIQKSHAEITNLTDFEDLSLAPDTEKDRQRTAIAESSILFRANTLLTKILDLYIKRVGQTYLEETIGEKIRDILADDVYCEVDPTRLPEASAVELERNWQRLFEVTKELWNRIYRSALRCPLELRVIFQHIRTSAKARFGAFMPTVIYSSVSGFLFLRFFCAAIMSPHLFGLVESWPNPRALRTYLLAAKSIQVLANMTTFGTKESWMSPMNAFYTAHRQEFMEFVDLVCNVPVDESTKFQQPRKNASSTTLSGYNMVHSIYERLPWFAKEGSLSLPYLIDLPRSVSGLINLWLDNVDHNDLENSISRAKQSHCKEDDSEIVASNMSASDPMGNFIENGGQEDDLAIFHATCLSLRRHTDKLAVDCAASATCFDEPIKRDDERDFGQGVAAQMWVKLAERMEIAPEQFWVLEVPPALLPEALSVAPSDQTSHPEQRQVLMPQKGVEKMAGSSTKSGDIKRRSRLGTKIGMAAHSKSSRDSWSTGSPSRSPVNKERSSKLRMTGSHSPSRDAEGNALRKLGWI